MVNRLRVTCLLLAALGLGAALLATAAGAAGFELPADTRWTTWEAESATAAGSWETIADPTASGGRYCQAGGAGAALQYHFRVQAPTTLRLRPLWWRTSERRAARTFPYPLAGQFGPSVLVPCGDRLYFTAPANGRVGVIDPQTEALCASLAPGGYLSDLTADTATRRLYACDARGDRVLVLDGGSATPTVLAQWPTAGQPWSLALAGGRLYVACRAGRCLQVLDPASGRVLQIVQTEAEPISLEAQADGTLLVRFQQSSVEAEKLQTLPPDQLQYGIGSHRAAVVSRDKRLETDPGLTALRIVKGGAAAEVAIPAGEATRAPRPPGLTELPASPDAANAVVSVGDRAYFTVPGSGRVGVVDLKADKLVQMITVGGWPVDLVTAPKGEKLYVADAAGRLVVIDTQKLEVSNQLRLPDGPLALAYGDTYNLQRPYLTPGIPLHRLYVLCAADRSLAVVDVKQESLLQRVPLGYLGRGVKVVPSPNPDWWPLLADDRIAWAMTPKVAVEPMPLALSPGDLRLAPAYRAGEAPGRRNSVKLAVGGAEKTFLATDNMLVQVDGKRNLDCSALCDPQREAQQPLQAGDAPGSVSVSLDGGPQFDWRRSLWTRPDNGMFLVSGTEEYWRYNAPAFRLQPGDHVLTLTSCEGRIQLDGVAVEPTADGELELALRPEPWSLHSQVPSAAYQGVFYDQEPVRFTVQVSNPGPAPRKLSLAAPALTDYLDTTKPLGQGRELEAPAGQTVEFPLELALNPDQTGRFTLTFHGLCEGRALVRDFRFVRLPKLAHPRLLYRPEDEVTIRQRIAAHPVLFRRYAQWLARMTAKEGKFPERFLPNGLTAGDLAQAAPPDAKDPRQQYGWRMYELGWRMLGAEFAARYVPEADKTLLQSRLKPLLEKPSTDTWCEYHHHGPFFPGAVEALVDMAPAEVRPGLPLNAFFARYKGDINVYPFTLMSLEEPLSPADRALVYRLAIMHNNLERYFQAHTGTRGGTWWQNPWSWCYCPTQGLFLSLLYTKNFMGEDRLLEKPYLRNYLTFMQHADPISDRDGLLPALRRPSGEPWRWILTATSRHPLEKWEYGWDEWLQKMEGPLPNEGQAVDDLMACKGMPLAGPLSAAPHHFNTAVSVPVALALGWYDPTAPTVKWSDLPSTALFDVDGWATMRSGWDQDATEVTFVCGARDHTTRHQPNHLTVFRAGHYLLGTPALWSDDGNCSPSWGNTVVAGETWQRRWQTNLFPVRSESRSLIDRFSAANWAYLSRERQLSGFAPAEGGWGGGVDLHGHTETMMLDEGKITAYETSPACDYVAGEAAGAWPSEELRGHQRQVLFLKPNLIIVYDRVQLGPEGHPARWVAATGPVAIDGKTFTITNGGVSLTGQVLLPREPLLEKTEKPTGWQWKKQQLLQIGSPREGSRVEYLVVLSTAAGSSARPQASARPAGRVVDLAIGWAGRQYQVQLNREGPVGGKLTVVQGGRSLTHDLPYTVEDTYRYWSSDPRYRSWVTEPRFEFIIPPWDRRRR